MHRSSRAAVASASSGDTIVVRGGTCQGNIRLTQPLVLIGEERPLLRGTGSGSVVTILADSCVIRGFLIERSGTQLVAEDAGILLKSNGNRIEHNTLSDVLFGIYLYGADGNTIDGNRITGRGSLPIGERGSGIHVWDSHANILRGNLITATRDGFYIQTANRTLIEDNTVSGVRYGLHYMWADSNVFLRNVFRDNVAGAAVMYSKHLAMRHNVFLTNRGFSSFGILFQDCHDLVADSNVIVDNVVGMFLESSTQNSFRHNIIARNDVALEMFQNSIENTFTENNLMDNISPLLLVGKGPGASWSVGGRGNYWSGYDGYDLDGDGIGDIPMRIENVFQYLEGKNANVRLFLYSPASQALAIAARAFPIIEISSEVDATPLMRPVPLGEMPAALLAEEAETDASDNPTWALGPAAAGLGPGMAVQASAEEKAVIQVDHLTKNVRQPLGRRRRLLHREGG